LIWGDPDGIFDFYTDGVGLALKHQPNSEKVQILFIFKNEDMDRGRLGIQTYQEVIPGTHSQKQTKFNYAIGAKKYEWTLNDDFSWTATRVAEKIE